MLTSSSMQHHPMYQNLEQIKINKQNKINDTNQKVLFFLQNALFGQGFFWPCDLVLAPVTLQLKINAREVRWLTYFNPAGFENVWEKKKSFVSEWSGIEEIRNYIYTYTVECWFISKKAILILVTKYFQSIWLPNNMSVPDMTSCDPKLKECHSFLRRLSALTWLLWLMAWKCRRKLSVTLMGKSEASLWIIWSNFIWCSY